MRSDEGMTLRQEAHLARIQPGLQCLVDARYRKGAAEHAGQYGGELLSVPTLKIPDHAIEEAIDLAVYLLTLKEKLLKESTDAAA